MRTKHILNSSLVFFTALLLTGTLSAFAAAGPIGTPVVTEAQANTDTGRSASLIDATLNTDRALSASETMEDTKAQALAGTLTAKITDQIILVVDHRLSLYNQQADGSWKRALDTYCGYGRNGLKAWNLRQEGDQTTPMGSFPILFSFGIAGNPGTAMSWRDVTPYSYWSGEKESYNTWVESMTPISGEHLSDYTICYRYAMAIGFNIQPTVYKRGSAIFLHCKNPSEWGSAGCVSVEERDMISLLQQCHNGCYIMIVPDEASIASF